MLYWGPVQFSSVLQAESESSFVQKTVYIISEFLRVGVCRYSFLLVVSEIEYQVTVVAPRFCEETNELFRFKRFDLVEGMSTGA